MNRLFWGGKLSLPMKIMVNSNFTLSWLTGEIKNTPAMKHRIKLGYSGACSKHVLLYDEVGRDHYLRAAKILLEGIDVAEKTVLDVGCGTGIVSFLLLQKNAKKVLGVDISQEMVRCCEKKAVERNINDSKIEFRLSDAEALRTEDNSFQAVVSSFVLGLVPNQAEVIAEMKRVLRPNGYLAIATHGPEHYWEGCEATFRSISKTPIIGYRAEYWPLDEQGIKRLLEKSVFSDIKIKRLKWQEEFISPEQAYNFFAATTSFWWLSKFPVHVRARESQKICAFFKIKNIRRISIDIILAYGRKSEHLSDMSRH